MFKRETPVFALALLGLRRDKQDALFREQRTSNSEQRKLRLRVLIK